VPEQADSSLGSMRSPTVHVVKPGETLYRISRRYGVAVDKVRKWNKLPDDIIEVGQRLIVGQEQKDDHVAPPQYSLSLDQFRQYSGKGNLIPLYREILADYDTPVSAFAKIDHGPSAYLLESVEGGEKWARYSFLGSGSPVVVYEDR